MWTGRPFTPGQVQNVKAAQLHNGFPPCSFWANVTPLNSRQTDKEYICFSQRNVTGHSCYKTSITVTTSAVTSDTGGRRTGTVHTAQLLDGDEEMAAVGIVQRLWTQSDGGSAAWRAPGPALSRRRPGSSSTSFSSQRWRRHHSSWSCWARSFVVVTLCVVNCSGSGGRGSQCILNESAWTRPEGSDNTDAFVTLLPMGHFSAT